ncbi:MAG TPA: hypothetical protein VIM30_07540 [Candidatus Limnocylindrales bacterium]|jgi:hypothetical protein
MTDNAIVNERSTLTGSGAATRLGDRPLRAAFIIVVIFSVGLMSGLAVSQAVRIIGQPATPTAGAASSEAAAQAHLSWLIDEHNPYPAAESVSAQQAHLSWLIDEHNSYPPAESVSAREWQAYRDFRLSEEGYTR